MSSSDVGSSSSGTKKSAEDQQTKKENKRPYENHKRTNYISWEDYFMGVASLAAQRSKDPKRQVGACIVSEDNKIVGVGYNGMPGGLDDHFPWKRCKWSVTEDKLTYVCHAEMNAIVNAIPRDIKGCKLYVTLYPCNECAKIIIQSGIKEIIYNGFQKNADKTSAAIKMFETMKIKCRLFKPERRRITIELGSDLNDASEGDPETAVGCTL